MRKDGSRRIQDLVHGFMEFRGREALLLDVLACPELQRLKRIRQLGLVHHVYPSAEHSRFSHSLGAAYVAVLFGRQIQRISKGVQPSHLAPDENDIFEFAMAALCHDLGHGPLSHAWENALLKTDNQSSFDDATREKWCRAFGLDIADSRFFGKSWHELAGLSMILDTDSSLHRALEKFQTGTAHRVVNILCGTSPQVGFGRLLSSEIDVDRADFVLRDSLMCGLRFGQYNLERLVASLSFGRYHDELVLGFDSDRAVRVVEQFLSGRRSLYETVYYHKTVAALEGMVGNLFSHLRTSDREFWMPSQPPMMLAPILKIITGNVISREELFCLDDSLLDVFLSWISSSRDDTTRLLAHDIIRRKGLKLVHVTPDQIIEFQGLSDWYQRLMTILSSKVHGDPKAWCIIEAHRQISPWSKDSSKYSFLINSQGVASRASTHPLLEGLGSEKGRKMKRIFVHEDAREDVQKMINKAVR